MPSTLLTTKITDNSLGKTTVASSQNNYVKPTNYLVIDDPATSLTGVLAGYDGEVLIIENEAGFEASAVVIPNDSGSSSVNNRFFSFDLTSNIYLYNGDRAIFVYRVSQARWVIKELFRNENERNDSLTTVASVGGTPPTFDDKLYTTIFSGNLCRLDIFIDTSVAGIANTAITCDLPPSVPTGFLDPAGASIVHGFANINGSTVPLPVLAKISGTSISFTFSAVAFTSLQAYFIIPIKGNLGF